MTDRSAFLAARSKKQPASTAFLLLRPDFMILLNRYLSVLSKKRGGLMSWITLVAVLVAWCLVGLGVAYLFGRFIHGVEASGSAGDLPLPVVTYLRRVRRAAKTPSRATGQTRTRREGIGGRRPH